MGGAGKAKRQVRGRKAELRMMKLHAFLINASFFLLHSYFAQAEARVPAGKDIRLPPGDA